MSDPANTFEDGRLRWIAVDFDGTLAEATWHPDAPDPLPIGAPMWDNIAKLKPLRDAGYHIAVHTARPWADYKAIRQWLRDHSIAVHLVVCGKFLAAAYIDDRAVTADSPEWTVPGA